MEEFIKDILPRLAGYRGRIIGSLVGFVAGLLWAFLGFWRALAFIFCIFVGYLVGRRLDHKGSLREFLNKVWPPDD